MQYRVNPMNGDELSILDFRYMRFPKNKCETEKLILYAIENGVNYFDTAKVLEKFYFKPFVAVIKWIQKL